MLWKQIFQLKFFYYHWHPVKQGVSLLAVCSTAINCLHVSLLLSVGTIRQAKTTSFGPQFIYSQGMNYTCEQVKPISHQPCVFGSSIYYLSLTHRNIHDETGYRDFDWMLCFSSGIDLFHACFTRNLLFVGDFIYLLAYKLLGQHRCCHGFI